MVAALKIADHVYTRMGIAPEDIKSEYPSTDPSYMTVRVKGKQVGLTFMGSGHHMGTHRIGGSPTNSVTDKYSRSWDHTNLYVVGCGSMVTSGSGNPTLTGAALSLMAADDMLRALAKNGGVVMINYNCGFVDAEYGKRSSQVSQTKRIQEREARKKFPQGSEDLAVALKKLDERFPTPERPTMATLMQHVLRAIEIAGPDHVGLGSDFDGVPCVPQGIDDVTFLPRITYELLAAGQSEETVKKVLGGNLLRVLAQVEQTAQSLAGEPAWQNDAATDSQPIAR
jgi:hypothetical protein